MLIVFDDSPKFLRSVTATLEHATNGRVIGVASDEALDELLASRQTIAGALLDGAGPRAGSAIVKTSKRLMRARPGISIAVMTPAPSDELTKFLDERGFVSFSKVPDSTEALTAWARVVVRAAAARRAWVVEAYTRCVLAWALTPGEASVVRHALEVDPSIKAVARATRLSAETIGTHIKSILMRSGASCFRALIAGILAEAIRLSTEHAERTTEYPGPPAPPSLGGQSAQRQRTAGRGRRPPADR